MWFNLAARNGDAVMASSRDRLEKGLTKEQIAEAQRHATKVPIYIEGAERTATEK